MKDKPKGNRINMFFYGAIDALSLSQVKEFKEVLELKHKEVLERLDAAIVAKQSEMVEG